MGERPSDADLVYWERHDSARMKPNARRARESEARLREALEAAADSLESLTFSMRMPVSPEIHLEGLRGSIPQILSAIRAALGKGGGT